MRPGVAVGGLRQTPSSMEVMGDGQQGDHPALMGQEEPNGVVDHHGERTTTVDGGHRGHQRRGIERRHEGALHDLVLVGEDPEQRSFSNLGCLGYLTCGDADPMYGEEGHGRVNHRRPTVGPVKWAGTRGFGDGHEDDRSTE